MKREIENCLRFLEGKPVLVEIHPVSGGDINEAYYVRTKEREYFVKLNRSMNKQFFELEAEGLKKIRSTNTISVPEVYLVADGKETNIPMLWLEWIEGEREEKTDVLLGERLAALHLAEAKKFGYDKNTYIGRLKQPNRLSESWLSYYRDYRLMGQLKAGKNLGTIKGMREKRMHRLLENLDQWIPDKPKSSLLHGDLWGGNWLAGKEGNPYLIDPSILYGDHEFELAFTELFGGFSRRFYEAYHSCYPLSPEYEARKELYQLYYLLVHLNMFGESYGPSVDRILLKYVK